MESLACARIIIRIITGPLSSISMDTISKPLVTGLNRARRKEKPALEKSAGLLRILEQGHLAEIGRGMEGMQPGLARDRSETSPLSLNVE